MKWVRIPESKYPFVKQRRKGFKIDDRLLLSMAKCMHEENQDYHNLQYISDALAIFETSRHAHNIVTPYLEVELLRKLSPK